MAASQNHVAASPDWLDNSFMNRVLQKGMKKDTVKVVGMDIQAATTAGDNYASQMFRCNLTVKDSPKDKHETRVSVIVKALPDGMMGEQLKKMSVFEREAEALSKVLPRVLDILREAYPGTEALAAECYYHQDAPRSLLVMEDLKRKGFVVGSRFEGLDMDHSALVLASMARLHVASLVLSERCPDMLKTFETQLWQEQNAEEMRMFCELPFLILSEEVLKWEEVKGRERYSEKLKKMKEIVIKETFKHFGDPEERLKVLIHGDSWVNNFMFRYDPTGKLTGMKFLDFQLTAINSPMMDLQYFIFTSTRPELRYESIETFLRIYHEAFSEAAERLGAKVPVPFEFEDAKKRFEDKYFWGLVVTCVIYPHFLLPPNETLKPDEFFQGEVDRFRRVFQKPDLKNVLKRGFEFFEEKGVF